MRFFLFLLSKATKANLMKYFSFLAFIFLFTSCMQHSKTGSGNIVTETRNIGSFNAVNASTSVHVDVAMGAKASVVVEADDNILPYVETSVSGGTLKISLRGINNLTNATINVHVTMPDVKGLDAEASAQITSKGILTGTGTIVLEASSSGGIDVSIDAPAVKAEASSSGDIVTKGRTKSVNAEASSSGSIKFFELHAENVRAEASSAGDIEVFASISIDGDASSAGSVRYTGGAASVKINEDSGGSVKAN
jgi:hypothetical protein